jgi:hypothetical protein
MTCDAGVYAAVIRQAVHDAVRAVLTASPDSLEGSRVLRNVTTWLAAEHGAAAVTDLAEELAADLAEAFEALAAAEDRPVSGRPRRLVPRHPATPRTGDSRAVRRRARCDQQLQPVDAARRHRDAQHSSRPGSSALAGAALT